MEPINGFNPTMGLPGKYATEPSWRRRLGLAMAEAAASIGAVDYEQAGLGDLGKPIGYLERQVARWRSQLESYSQLPGYARPELPGFEEVAGWLDANQPHTWTPGLIHGDFHLANMMCAYERPELAAIVDWELSTIGDPLLDLGWLLATWPIGGEPEDNGILPFEPSEGLASPAELIDAYGAHSHRDLSAIIWYEVLACYKLGVILEGTYARAVSGMAPLDVGDRLHGNALALFARATVRLQSA
jgi:aminoglycoside phosphotransferase (APT) family kinase protein